MKYKIGDRVKIIKMKFKVADLVGLTGVIRKIRTEPYTEREIKTGEIASYLVEADNFGHLMKSGSGSKKVYAWRPGNITNRFSSELSLI